MAATEVRTQPSLVAVIPRQAQALAFDACLWAFSPALLPEVCVWRNLLTKHSALSRWQTAGVGVARVGTGARTQLPKLVILDDVFLVLNIHGLDGV